MFWLTSVNFLPWRQTQAKQRLAIALSCLFIQALLYILLLPPTRVYQQQKQQQQRSYLNTQQHKQEQYKQQMTFLQKKHQQISQQNRLLFSMLISLAQQHVSSLYLSGLQWHFSQDIQLTGYSNHYQAIWQLQQKLQQTAIFSQLTVSQIKQLSAHRWQFTLIAPINLQEPHADIADNTNRPS